MSRKGIEEIIIAAACGEPIGPQAQARLERALRKGTDLRELHGAQNALNAELRVLREALQGMAADGREAREAALLNALRVPAPRRARRQRRRRIPLLAAAAAAAGIVAVAVIAATWITFGQPSGGGRRVAVLAWRPEAGQRRAAAPASSMAFFQPLMYAPRPSAWESYSVVRVRIPLSSLAPNAAAGLGGTVDADVLIGEDGLARAIRFDDTRGFPVAAAANSGGTR